MTVFTFAAAIVASLEATGQASQGFVFSAPEPLLMAAWGMTLLVLATGARNRFAAHRSQPARSR